MDSIYTDVLKHPLIQTLVIILVAMIVKEVSRQIIDRIIRRLVKSHHYKTRSEERKREDTLSSIFSTLIGIIIWVAAIGTILTSVLNVNLAAAAASLGVLGVVIGLGAQTTIRDYVAGIYILIENQYRVGDIITLSGGTTGALGTSGVVEDITLRITKLRDLDGTLNIVRNGEASIITNRTFQYSSVVIDISVAYSSDIDKVEEVINRVGTAMLEDENYKKVISEPIQFLRVDKLEESGVLIKALGTVEPASQWDVAGQYRRDILTAFKKEGIEIPYPHLVVHAIDKKTLKK